MLDAHAHLGDVDECRVHGVYRMLVNGTRPSDWDAVLKTAERNGYDAALGVHPFYVDEWNDAAECTLRRFAERCAAIGEIGLDKLKCRETLPLQMEVCSKQLAISIEFDRPVCLHLRNAWSEFFQMLDDAGIRQLRGICHNFTGSWDIARRLLQLGLHLSFNTPILKDEARKVLDTIQRMPLERMLTETDSPDMALPGEEIHRPWQAQRILERLSQLRGIPLTEMDAIITNNYDALFSPLNAQKIRK